MAPQCRTDTGVVTPDTYHHGDLPNALRAAATELIAEKGLGGFSLREGARRAGVSHTAPAHHFGDTAGLLTSLALEGFAHLEAQMRAAAESESEPYAKLSAIGRAYVETGTSNPSYCTILFREDLVRIDDPNSMAAAQDCMGVLKETLVLVAEEIQEQAGVEISSSQLDTAAKLCWTSMHGLVVLWPSMQAAAKVIDQQDQSLSLAELIDGFTKVIVNGMRSSALG